MDIEKSGADIEKSGVDIEKKVGWILKKAAWNLEKYRRPSYVNSIRPISGVMTTCVC